MNPGLIKTYGADGAIPARAIVKAGSAAGKMAAASAATDAIFGVNERLDAADGELVDIVHTGIVEVVCGGNLAYGDFFTSDANGRAIKAAPGAGVNMSVAGRILEAGVPGDIVRGLLIITQIQG
ncbi:MAG: DUF2190 domain-containing protein [Desulfovibrionaceae bacterium]|nr:DUF2190 domain-containing protein [Desulfovibrionaceae bacterium]MBF0513634.1 DUF2190 domain-containing protein [Desulfovibrionaceae bacterium]